MCGARYTCNNHGIVLNDGFSECIIPGDIFFYIQVLNNTAVTNIRDLNEVNTFGNIVDDEMPGCISGGARSDIRKVNCYGFNGLTGPGIGYCSGERTVNGADLNTVICTGTCAGEQYDQ